MRELKDFAAFEVRLREAIFCDSQGDPRAVWNRYLLIKQGKEVYMKMTFFRLAIGGVLLAFLVVFGIVGMKWFFEYQKGQRIAQGEAILVTMTIGDVQVRKMGADNWREVSVDEVVEGGDTLRTGADSACELQIIERGVYRLEANTEILVAKLVNEDGNLQAKMYLDKGTIGLKPKRLKQGEVFEVETATAVAAVRGTVFLVKVTEKGDTKIAVAEGQVALTPKVPSLERAKKEAKITEKAYRALREALAPTVEVKANEEVTLQKQVVTKIDQKVATVIEEKATTEGPITEEKIESVKNRVVEEVIREIVGPSTEISAVPVVVEKNEISEEVKNLLENVRKREIVVKKRVSVRFSANVPGVVMFLNGERIGTLPLSKIFEEGFSGNLTFEKEGYESVTEDLVFTQPTNIVVKLTPVRGGISVSTEGDGKEQGDSSKEVKETNQPSLAKKDRKGKESSKQLTNVTETKPQLKPGDMIWEKPFTETIAPVISVVYRGNPNEDRMVCSIDNRIVIMNMNAEVVKSFLVGKGTTYDAPFIATPKGIFVRDDDGVVYSYDYNGNQKWMTKLPKSPAWIGISLAKDEILIPVVQNRIYILRMTTGEILSTVETTSQIYASPVMIDDKLLVYAQENGIVVGYDRENKVELWRKDLGKRFILPLHGYVEGPKKIALLPLSGELIAIDAVSGNIVWRKDMPGVTFALKPVSQGRLLYVASKNVLQVIDVLSGEVWARLTMKDEVVSFQVVKKNIYLLDAKGQVRVFTSKGEAQWSYEAGSNVQGLAVHPEGVYVFRKNAVVKLVNEASKLENPTK